MHDDQHGTAIVVLAGLTNAMKITGRTKENTRIVVNGLGAAGTAIIRLLLLAGYQHITACDSRGIVSSARPDLNDEKKRVVEITTPTPLTGTIHDAIVGADVFIGVSVAGVLTRDDIRRMNPDSIIFAMANPTPEIMPVEAHAGGARIIATGRSDYPNQINNVLAFPGIFKGALKYRIPRITDDMKLAAAYTLADYVGTPTVDCIIPDPLDKHVAEIVAESMRLTQRA